MAAVSPGRLAAYAVVRRVFEQGAYADRALQGEARELTPRDRSLAKQLAFGTVQRQGTLAWIAARHVNRELDPAVSAALWLGLYELLYLRTAEHAAIAEAVELAKPSPGHRLVNAVLRRVQREGVELPGDDDPAGAAIRHSHPEWLVRLWWDQLGSEQTRALLAADNEPAEVALRVNSLVDAPGIVLPPGRRDGDALVVDGPLDLVAGEAWRVGAVVAQSRAAQLVAPMVAPRPGERILDLCAAPGGKTTHLAALMGDEGEIVAVERHAGRAKALRATCERLRATCVTVVEDDARTFRADEPFDRVLLDPPCSGLGTLRSHPDLRWRMTPETIDGLVAVQDELLATARAAVRPGGRLVYSTCTISAAEERVAGPERRQTLPHRDGTDGFYLAAEGAGSAPSAAVS
ncbi:MAG: rRNA (cytosine967-C5)-methyltransferase [Solirubrobacteraceae bacterium]|jgi:16S rRNA (cytosine967-C5)-methyltransferase|nr:rRNA (cytosine967-C5)-methyltransferase [Solirubrobacteraceae bacterium]